MRFERTVYQTRLSRLCSSSFFQGEIQSLILCDLNNIRYLTGFSGSDGVLVIRPQSAILLVDGRYVTQAQEEAKGTDLYHYQDKVAGIEAVLEPKDGDMIGFEASAVSYEFYQKLADRFRKERLKPLSEELNDLRAVKDDDEISCLRRAAELSGGVLESVSRMILPGISERDLALEIDFGAKRAGAEKMAFETIVASGVNAALPHAKPGRKILEYGDLIVVDYGVVSEGYCSDETCTFCLGFADDRKREIYARVKEAHDQALEAIRPGVPCSRIDQIARSCLAKYGLDGYFTHGTGHGVGLEVHEAPRIAKNSDAILVEGMVVTIEPGVYIPGQWGIRIEDTVLVRENGADILTKMPKDFIIL
ncbi:MAG: putative peptidase [Syntrophus sp. PtaU1.Bin208]|nr:MAG: putative peptidase [Syntrophus sp. PtaU1.Bin208]